MSLPAKYKLTLTTPTGMRSEQSGTISRERYAVLCGVLGGKLPDDLVELPALDSDNARLIRERDQALAALRGLPESLAELSGCENTAGVYACVQHVEQVLLEFPQ